MKLPVLDSSLPRSALVLDLPSRSRVCTCVGGAGDLSVSVLSRGRLRYSEQELLQNSEPLLQLVLEDQGNHLLGTFMQGFQVGCGAVTCWTLAVGLGNFMQGF